MFLLKSRIILFFTILAICLAAIISTPLASQTPRAPRTTLFEGARLILGDGHAPIESSAFIVENGRFTQRRTKGRAAASRRRGCASI